MMSGGVDSSVTAYLLKQAGHDVTGVTMKFYEAGQEGPGCCGGSRDAGIAKESARFLGIPHRTLDEVAEFKAGVIDLFTQAYQSGETPNPCMECNRTMKFGRILGLAKSWGFDAVATGHYARIEKTGDGLGLFKAKDAKKDQSYFLYMLQEAQLKKIIFPLAGLEKSEVRKIASEAGLPTANKPESQDICFVGAVGGDYRNLIGGSAPGPIIQEGTGRVLGTHAGFARYTIGQREGLGVSVGHPLYVTSIDPQSAAVKVGELKDLEKTHIELKEMSWVNPVSLPRKAEVKIRYRFPQVPCSIETSGDGCRVVFESPQRAPSPGQFAVIYDGERVLGGGKIAKNT